LNGDEHAVWRGAEELPSKSNYYLGADPRRWQTDVPNYRGIWADAVYPGVSLHYYGNDGHLEYDFIVDPKTRTTPDSISGSQS